MMNTNLEKAADPNDPAVIRADCLALKRDVHAYSGDPAASGDDPAEPDGIRRYISDTIDSCFRHDDDPRIFLDRIIVLAWCYNLLGPTGGVWAAGLRLYKLARRRQRETQRWFDLRNDVLREAGITRRARHPVTLRSLIAGYRSGRP
jgi:hypothetical protein